MTLEKRRKIILTSIYSTDTEHKYRGIISLNLILSGEEETKWEISLESST